LYHPIISSSNHRIIASSHHRIISSSNHRIIPSSHHRIIALPQVIPQQPVPRCAFEFLDGFFLDLPDPFPCQVKLFTDLVEGVGSLTVQTVEEADDFCFAFADVL
jgi:hypothetical protein